MFYVLLFTIIIANYIFILDEENPKEDKTYYILSSLCFLIIFYFIF